VFFHSNKRHHRPHKLTKHEQYPIIYPILLNGMHVFTLIFCAFYVLIQPVDAAQYKDVSFIHSRVFMSRSTHYRSFALVLTTKINSKKSNKHENPK